MKPVELIVNALAEAARAGSARVDATGAGPAYQRLLSGVRDRIGEDTAVLDRHIVDPDQARPDMIRAVAAAGADSDAALLSQAEDLLSRLHPAGPHTVVAGAAYEQTGPGGPAVPQPLRIGAHPGIVALVVVVLIGMVVGVFAVVRALWDTPTVTAGPWGGTRAAAPASTTTTTPTTTPPPPADCPTSESVVRFQGTAASMTIFVDRCAEPRAGKRYWLMAVARVTGRKPSISFQPLADVVGGMRAGDAANRTSLEHTPEDPAAQRCYQVFQTNAAAQADYERRQADKSPLTVAGTRIPATLTAVSPCEPFTT